MKNYSQGNLKKKWLKFLGTKAKAVEYRNDLNHPSKVDKESRQVLSLISKLKEKGINNVVFRTTLARGFDYYTGTIFEMYDVNPQNPRALFGGGRYDDLVGLFDVEKVSGIGFGGAMLPPAIFWRLTIFCRYINHPHSYTFVIWKVILMPLTNWHRIYVNKE